MIRAKGFSVPELLIVVGLFSGFLLTSYALLASGLKVWDRTSSSQEAGFQLAQARAALRRDLSQASSLQLEIARLPGSAEALTEGNVLWLLSAEDEGSGMMGQLEDGTPLWQRNIIYYAMAPSDHAQRFGQACGRQPGHCPHLYLIRKVVDSGVSTNLSSPALNSETLLRVSQIGNYLTPPRGFMVSGGRGLEKGEVVAQGLVDLSFRIKPGGLEGEVETTISVFNVQEAGQKVSLGRVDLRENSFTHKIRFSGFPAN